MPATSGWMVTRVYPRPRGGAARSARMRACETALSPPTRGSRYHECGCGALQGSIPAHAGEPKAVAARVIADTVYPRPRGGARETVLDTFITRGLSPPTRGSHVPRIRESTILGSIPAHAGEPRTRRSGRPSSRVYPRPRGGALVTIRANLVAWGLSPPTRGSRTIAISDPPSLRSIPAHAGEPLPLSPLSPLSPVYPRPRGGAADR